MAYFPVLLLRPGLRLAVGLDRQFVPSEQEQRSGHLLDVIGAVGVEYVADLEHLEGLLDLPLVPQDQALEVKCYSGSISFKEPLAMLL